MKSRMIPILSIIYIAAATLLFGKKMHHADDEMDKMERALAGAKKYVLPGSNISFRNINGKNELHYRARYQFTPDYMAYKTSNFDTVLTMCPVLAMMPIMSADSVFRAIGNAGKKLIWQNKDDDYYYFLTCSLK